MKQIKKYILAISVLLTTLLFSGVVNADDTIYTDGSLLYKIEENGNITIVNYFGKEDEVKVPMAIGEHFVTAIANGSFKDSNIKKVELPETIESIGYDAFSNIESVNISYFDKDNIKVEKENPIEKQKPQIIDKEEEKDTEIDDNNESISKAEEEINDIIDNTSEKETEEKQEETVEITENTDQKDDKTSEIAIEIEKESDGMFTSADVDLSEIIENDSKETNKDESEEIQEENIGILVETTRDINKTMLVATVTIVCIGIVAAYIFIKNRKSKISN